MTSFMNNRTMVPTHDPGILDFAPGAAAAFSLRNLSYTYVGPVVTVRRSTDSAEADFTANEVSDGTLAAWCGGGDGFVKQWWSQTGSNHASNSTAAQQPQLIDAGSLITEGGKAAVQFDGTDDRLIFTAISSLSPWTIFEVKKRPSAGVKGLVVGRYGAGASSYSAWEYSDNNTYATNKSGGLSVTGATSSQNVFVTVSTTDTPSGVAAFRDGAQLFGTTSSLTRASYFDAIGTASTVDMGNGVYQEILIYPADMTASRQRIEANMAWYF